MEKYIYTRTRMLITVMTYPHPSKSYDELVCTAGITEDGELIRLYPVDYRYLSKDKQYRKYQWIEVDLAQKGGGNDNRKESRKPIADSIQLQGPPLSTKNGWADRRFILEKVPISTAKQLTECHIHDKTSLGIVKPHKVLDVTIEETDRDWKPEWQMVLNQVKLFGEQTKPLMKIPYKFSYLFLCDDDDKPHKLMIEDWELGVLYLKELERKGSEEKAIQSVRDKYLTLATSNRYDTHLFLGTVFPFPSWVVIGVFYPLKQRQLALF